MKVYIKSAVLLSSTDVKKHILAYTPIPITSDISLINKDNCLYFNKEKRLLRVPESFIEHLMNNEMRIGCLEKSPFMDKICKRFKCPNTVTPRIKTTWNKIVRRPLFDNMKKYAI